MENIKDVAAQFNLLGEVDHFEICGAGHINNTYLVTTKGEYGTFNYIIQKINTNIFKDPDGLMRNVFAVTEYIRGNVKARGEDAGRSTIMYFRTKDGKLYYTGNEGGVYRAYLYIGNVASIQVADQPHLLYLAGKGFGRFQRNLDGFAASELCDVIPNFHNTESRFADFERAVNENRAGRAASCQKEIDFFLNRREYASRVVKMLKDGTIPVRVTHNDTKINNVLIDTYEDIPVAVIDLDTVMSGSILYDFGDSIRSGANIGAEDEADLSRVGFSIELFRAFAQGFLGEVGGKLNKTEIDNLAFGAILMTYECGMRFLGDYLNGDVYFKVHRDGHNLDRTRTQIKMIEDMERALPEMNKIVKENIPVD